MFLFYCFGVIFDDGGNFITEGDDAYDKNFNDYVLVNPRSSLFYRCLESALVTYKLRNISTGRAFMRRIKLRQAFTSI